MNLEDEFQAAKIMLMFDKTIEKIKRMRADLGIVDLPEFAKPKEDRLTTQTDVFISNLIKEGRFDEVLLGLI